MKLEMQDLLSNVMMQDYSDFLDEIQEYIDGSEVEDLKPEDEIAIAAFAAARASIAKQVEPVSEGEVIWRFIRFMTGIEMPLRMIDYTGLLYPNEDEYYDTTLTKSAAKILQKRAVKLLEDEEYVDETHMKHLQEIVAGNWPYGYKIKKEEE